MTTQTKTEIRTEFAGFGLRANGKWYMITTRMTTAERAQAELDEKIACINKYPDVYEPYEDYKVMSRVYIQTFEDWHE